MKDINAAASLVDYFILYCLPPESNLMSEESKFLLELSEIQKLATVLRKSSKGPDGNITLCINTYLSYPFIGLLRLTVTSFFSFHELWRPTKILWLLMTMNF